MDSDVSDVAETGAHILTFDIPDDALERAAAIAGQQAVTIGFCTHWYYCGWPLGPPPR
jgi:hypothetical protein